MMRNLNKVIHVLLFFCFIPICLTVSGCTTHNTSMVNIHSWTKDVDSLAQGKADPAFWSKVRPHSNLGDAYWRLGGFYQKQGKHKKAIAEFIKAIKTKTDDARVYNSLAISYDALKEYRFSEMAYKDAIALAPDQAYLYNNYACSTLLRGDREAAAILFEKAASLDSESRRIKNNLSMFSSRADNKETTEAPVLPVVKHGTATAPIAATSSAADGNWFTDLIDSTLRFFGFVGDDKSADEDIVSVGATSNLREMGIEENTVAPVIKVNTLQIAAYRKDNPHTPHKKITAAM